MCQDEIPQHSLSTEFRGTKSSALVQCSLYTGLHAEIILPSVGLCVKLLKTTLVLCKRTMNSHTVCGWHDNESLCFVWWMHEYNHMGYISKIHVYLALRENDRTFLIFIYCSPHWCTRLKILFRIWTGNRSLTVNPSSFTLPSLFLWSLCICWPAMCLGWPCFTAFQQSQELRFERPPWCSVSVTQTGGWDRTREGSREISQLYVVFKVRKMSDVFHISWKYRNHRSCF